MQYIKTKNDEKQTTGSKVNMEGRGQTHRYDKYYNPKSRYKSRIILYMHVVYLALDDLESSISQKFSRVQYISLFHLVAAPHTNFMSSKTNS